MSKTSYTFTVVVQHDGEPSDIAHYQAEALLKMSANGHPYVRVTHVEGTGQDTTLDLCPHGYDVNAGCFACQPHLRRGTRR